MLDGRDDCGQNVAIPIVSRRRTLKRVVLSAPHEASLTSAPTPDRASGQVLLRVVAVGICGSDVHAYRGLEPFLTYPRVLGHELALKVEEVDRGDSDFLPGELVTVEPYIACGRCYPCSRGSYNCCEKLEVLGIHRDGGLQEYITVPENKIHRSAPQMDIEELALIEPLSVGAHAVSRAGVTADDFVFVIGAGPIGIAAAQVARLRGATVAIGDVLERRLALAADFGIEHVLDLSSQNGVEEVKALTGGVGAHVVIEAVGKKQTIEATTQYVAASGRIAIVGIGKETISFPQQVFNKKEITFLGCRNSRGLFPELISNVAAGKLTMKPLVTHRIPLRDVPNMLRWLDSSPGEAIKVIVSVD